MKEHKSKHTTEHISQDALRDSVVVKLKYILLFTLFVIFFAMVIIGQKTTGPLYLTIQLFGIIGILLLMYYYNRKYQ